MKIYDLVIIGGGSAGLNAADLALQMGLKTALIEKNRIGGDCTWTGCVPSKALLKTAKAVQLLRDADQLGLPPRDESIDFSLVVKSINQVIQEIYAEESPDALRKKGLDVFIGEAHFRNENTIFVKGAGEIQGRKFVIASGAKPDLPPIPGLMEVPFHTYEDIWSLQKLPETLLILGAGSVGVELGQAFQRLGAQVQIFELQSRILPEADSRAAGVISAVLQGEGAEIFTETRIQKIEADADTIVLHSQKDSYRGDALLVSVGRSPSLEGLNLSAAGVAYDQQGIAVDRHMQTSNPIVFAAGDVTGGPQFTHVAGWQAFAAVRNAFLPGRSSGSLETFPWTIFTDPEVAWAGFSEAEAQKRFGKQVIREELPLSSVDRAHTDRALDGYLEVILLPKGKVVGATIVGPRAGEMIAEWNLAISQSLTIEQIAYTLQSYPTYALANMQLAAKIQAQSTLGGLTGKLIRWWLKLTGSIR